MITSARGDYRNVFCPRSRVERQSSSQGKRRPANARFSGPYDGWLRARSCLDNAAQNHLSSDSLRPATGTTRQCAFARLVPC